MSDQSIDNSVSNQDTFKWYCIKCVPSREESVVARLYKKVDNVETGRVDWFGDVFYPKIVKKVTSKSIHYGSAISGYIFVNIDMNDISFNAVRSIEGVTGFMGGTKPIQVSQAEIESMKKIASDKSKEGEKEAISYVVDEVVEIVNESLFGFKGVIKSVDKSSKSVLVVVTVFGKSIEVNLKYSEIKRVTEESSD